MDCEICGRNDSLTLISVQGTQMWTCRECKKHGLEVPKQFVPATGGTKVISAPEEEFFDLVENYGKIIQNARQKIGLDTKQFAMKIAEQESFVRKIEAEKAKPDEKMIKKIEKLLNIKIYKKVEE